jgi:hypothetical protein
MSNEKLGLAHRDKYWSERNTDEKIYALYNEVMQMRYQLTQVTTLLDEMLTHSHADGKVVAPINRERRGNEHYIPVALQDNKEPR